MTDEDAYQELSAYTLQKRDPEFVHQYVVDAYAAQHPDAPAKPIRTYFALVGLYLHLEKGFTGREVQLAHMRLGQEKTRWPTFAVPPTLGNVTAADVLTHAEGAARDRAINLWCRSVWDAWVEHHSTVASLVADNLHI